MSKSFNDRMTDFWREHYADDEGRCRLCGGTNTIHDRKRDIRLPCLCPNARAQKPIPTLVDAVAIARRGDSIVPTPQAAMNKHKGSAA